MTHDEKLDKILYALMSRVSTRIKNNGEDDKRLTMDFICNALFVKEGHEDWETEFLERRLLSDGFIQFIEIGNVRLPEITDLGIKYVQNGGYKKERSNRSVDEELKRENLKNAKRSWIALLISIISVAITMAKILIDYFK
jgi:hypothetical protein